MPGLTDELTCMGGAMDGQSIPVSMLKNGRVAIPVRVKLWYPFPQGKGILCSFMAEPGNPVDRICHYRREGYALKPDGIEL